MKLITLSEKLFSNFYYDKNERKYFNSKKCVLILGINDYYFYDVNKKIVENNFIDYKKYVISVNFYIPNFKQIFLVYPFIYKKLNSYAQRNKIRKFYSSINIEFIDYSNWNILDLFNSALKSIKLYIYNFFNDDLINYKYDGISYGELIIDTYLRFNNKPSYNTKNPDFLFVYFFFFLKMSKIKRISKKLNIKVLLTSFSTYIQFGLPLRFFLNKKNVEIYSKGELNKIVKKHKYNEMHHSFDFLNFKQDFNSLSNKKDLITKGLNHINNLIEGKAKLKHVFNDQNSLLKNYLNCDGILFLHDFFDSPHIYGDTLFKGFYNWTDITINYCQKNNINLFIKPHPSLFEKNNTQYIEKLKKKYPNVKFLPSTLSKKELFDNIDFKFGLTVYGNIAFELAYKNKIIITCGINPFMNSNFVYNARTQKEYFELISNFRNLKKVNNLDELGIYSYMKFIFNNPDLKGFEEFNINYRDSSSKILNY